MNETPRWVVLGALHFDISASLDRRWLMLGEDDQTWTDISTELGGVAGNIARRLCDVQEQVEFIAVVGDDPLGQFLIRSAESTISGARVRPAVIPGTQTGVVKILHIKEGVQDVRLMVAPKRSAVDSIRCADVKDALAELREVSSDLILDGYMLREQLDLWLNDLHELKKDGWRIHLELVPHNGWRYVTEHTFDRLSMLCTTISASLGTLERILGLHPDLELGAGPRTARFMERAQARSQGTNARIKGRFGALNAEYCIQFGGGMECELWHYNPELLNATKGVQDSLLVLELTNSTALAQGTRISFP